MNKLDKKGVTARNLYNEIATEGKTYNERRSQQTARMRSALEPVWAALKSGTPVNGCCTITDWCRWANPTAKYPERWFQKVMGEVSSPRPKVITLKPGSLFKFEGNSPAYRIPADIFEQQNFIAQVKRRRTFAGKTTANLYLGGMEVIEEPKEEKKTAPKVTHARHSKRLSVCENHMPNLPREKGKVFAAKWDDATCERCKKCLASINERKAAQEKNEKEINDRYDRESAFFATLPADMPMREKRRLFGESENQNPAAAPERKMLTVPLTKKQYEHFDWMYCGSFSQDDHDGDKLAKEISYTKTKLTFPADRALELAEILYDYKDTMGVSSGDDADCPSDALNNLSSKIHAVAPETIANKERKAAEREEMLKRFHEEEGATEELSWAQKVCITGSPEREQLTKENIYRLEHPAIDPNADDEFAGEGD